VPKAGFEPAAFCSEGSGEAFTGVHSRPRDANAWTRNMLPHLRFQAAEVHCSPNPSIGGSGDEFLMTCDTLVTLRAGQVRPAKSANVHVTASVTRSQIIRRSQIARKACRVPAA
jgi:hypothetical protein